MGSLAFSTPFKADDACAKRGSQRLDGGKPSPVCGSAAGAAAFTVLVPLPRRSPAGHTGSQTARRRPAVLPLRTAEPGGKTAVRAASPGP